MIKDEGDYKLMLMLALEGRRYKCQAHEDKFTKYIPDVSFSGNYVDGWLEVKYCPRIPTSLGKLDHWTKGQEQWLRDFGTRGSGHCYLLVGTPRMHAMWSWQTLATVRDLPWKKALGYVCISDDDWALFIQKFDRRVRIRG